MAVVLVHSHKFLERLDLYLQYNFFFELIFWYKFYLFHRIKHLQLCLADDNIRAEVSF